MAYTGTTPKDLNLSTPDGASEYGNILDDAIIEVKKVFKYTQAINTVTTDTTLDATYSFVLANKASAIAITLPTASTVASSTFTKEYRIRNIGAGTCTVTATVNLNGTATVNPTLAQYEEMYLWTNGTTWYGMRFSSTGKANSVPIGDNTGNLTGWVTEATGLSMNGEASANTTGTTTLNIGSVTNGDRIFVSACIGFSTSGASSGQIYISKNSGTATITFLGGTSQLPNLYYAPSASSYSTSCSGVLEVTGNGTLTIASAVTGASAVSSNRLYAFFIKKQ